MTIRQHALRIVAEKLDADPASIRDDTLFTNIGVGADSLDSVELAMAFEAEFGLEIDDDVAASIRTFGEAVAYLEKRVGGVAG